MQRRKNQNKTAKSSTHLLLVCENIETLRLARMSLSADGYAVLTASTKQEAWELCDNIFQKKTNYQ